MFRLIAIALVFFVAVQAEATAFCTAPSPPSQPFTIGPSTPYCGNYGDLSGCDQWDIDRYRADLESHMDALRRYAEEADDFADEAIRYANCEINQAVDDWNSFVGQ